MQPTLMSTQIDSDSSLDFHLLPGPDRGRTAPAGVPSLDPLAVVDLTSEGPLPQLLDKTHSAAAESPCGTAYSLAVPAADAVPAAAAAGESRAGMFWLEGNVLMCACPECRAPMSVRLWLMVADCWRCQTSIELTEEQEREALRLLQKRDAARRQTRADAPPPPRPSGVRRTPEAARTGKTPSVPAVARTPESPSRSPAASASRSEPTPSATTPAAEAAIAPPKRVAATYNEPRRRLARQRLPGAWLLRLLKDSPAWLTSLLIHLIVLMILALLTPPREENFQSIRLNAVVSASLRQPGQEEIAHPAEVVKFDLPVPEKIDLQNRRTRETVIRADQEARELRLVDAADPNLPDLERLKLEIGRSDGSRMAIAARDPRVRVELIKQEGGTTLTEAAVARGLRWMAEQQQPDGRWRLDGGVRSDSAATSLALLPFLGAGQTHLTGRHKDAVARGLRWLVSRQKPDGDLRADSVGNTGMYAHGQGAIVLCEAYLMTGDDALRTPAQKAIDFIVQAQFRDGGWRYQPAQEISLPAQRSDTSVVGWQLMALQSARAAKLNVPAETFELSSHYLDSAQFQDGALYGYQPGHRPMPTMTAEALLCRIYLGWTKADPPLSEGLRYLLETAPPHPDRPNVYYWYYGTQAMHHAGGREWERWNFLMRDALVNTQEKQGKSAGSWAPRGEHASAGGRLYMTSLAVCTLEVYYRHLPIFRQIDVK